MKYYKEYRKFSTCDNCNKQQSQGNRLCNNCFSLIVGNNNVINF